MPDLRSRVAIDYGALALQHIPPFGYRIIEQGKQKTIEHEYVLRPGTFLQRSTDSKFRMGITFEVWADRGVGRELVNAINTALKGNANGLFSYYVNSFQYYANCFIEGGRLTADYENEVKGVIPCSATIASKIDTLITSDTEIPAGPWEEFVAGGDPKEAVVAEQQKSSYPLFVPGEIAVTPTGQDYEIVAEAANGVALEIVSIQITAPQRNGQSGNTVVRVSDTAKGGSTANSIVTTLAYNEKHSRQAGSFGAVSGGTGVKLYVYIEETAKHQDVNITVVVRG